MGVVDGADVSSRSSISLICALSASYPSFFCSALDFNYFPYCSTLSNFLVILFHTLRVSGLTLDSQTLPVEFESTSRVLPKNY